MRSTSSSETWSFRRSYRPVVRADSWLAICWATSSFPPFRRYSVIPVARKLRQETRVRMPASMVRRPIIRYTSCCAMGRFESSPACPGAVRKRNPFPSPSRYSSRYYSSLWWQGTNTVPDPVSRFPNRWTVGRKDALILFRLASATQ